MTLIVSCVVACVAMAANDALATFLVVAEAKDRAALAGHLDMAGDVARIALYSFAAESLLRYGWRGWVALIPVLIVSNITTRLSTRWAHKHTQKGASS